MLNKYLKAFLATGIVLCVWVCASAEGVYEAWVARYNGPGNDYDQAVALAIDGSGNVYVTGYSYRDGFSDDYATLKYYPNGDTAWVRRYNGSANFNDEASALAVDGSGNVYVTGYSSGGASDWDYATLKYYPNGDTAWVRRYNGPGNYTDLARALAVDDSGNVYVTGGSWGSGPGSDYATLKYYPNGDTAWVRRYHEIYGAAYAVAVDNSGNVYVTGYSAGSGSSVDYATIKYKPNGDTAWVRRYNGGNIFNYAHAVAVDGSGNVYVTGNSSSGSSYDYATIKYYPNGDTAWVRRYNGPGNLDDVAHALAVDGSGNVYVTGGSDGSSTYFDYATIKYYPNGDTAWVRRYVELTGAAYAVAVDGSGNVYVTGYSVGSGSGIDYATIKYNPNGDTAWVRRYNGTGNSGDVAYALAVDGSGNVYVTGYSPGPGSGRDYATIKYARCQRSGELNSDGKVNVTDVVYLVNIVFKSWAIPGPTCLADVNGDSFVSMADIIYLANHVFKRGPAPVQTGPCCD